MPKFDQLLLPDSPSQITADFLTAVLRSTGTLSKVVVTAVQIQPLAAQASFNAQLARLNL
ncbi:MAG: hypothetical protein HGA53_07645, partial [Anaerolineaceae bacterium]|nr:hypothetical protein [Anaerolineaceae bacterium]